VHVHVGGTFLVDVVGEGEQAGCPVASPDLCNSRYYVLHAPVGKDDVLILVSRNAVNNR
jgi:hypothetical protein